MRTATTVAAKFPKEKGLDLRNADGKTPLMVAAATGSDCMAFELVKAKADVNAVYQQDKQPDRTAMGMVACAKRSDILDMLSRHGGYGLCERVPKGNGYQQGLKHGFSFLQ